MSQQLNQGSTVYAGDRLRFTMALTGKDPATGLFGPVPTPADVEIIWREGQMTPGGNLVFETDVSRFDELKALGGPMTADVLVDKVSQSGAGQIRVLCQATRKVGGAFDVYIVKEFKMATAPGARPTQPVTPPPVTPPTTGTLPTGMTLGAVLLTPTPLPGK